jgi:biotin carboxyl carrier protein
MKFRFANSSQTFDVEILSRDGALLRLRIDGEEITAEIEPVAAGGALVRSRGRSLRVHAARRRNSILVTVGPALFDLISVEGRSARGAHGLATPAVTAPMPGKVLKVIVAKGDAVAAGQPLIVLEAMKMETTLYAESDAIVKKVHAAPGAMVDHGAVLLELSPPDSLKPESATPNR